jgi:hypothetical protein
LKSYFSLYSKLSYGFSSFSLDSKFSDGFSSVSLDYKLSCDFPYKQGSTGANNQTDNTLIHLTQRIM